MSIDLLAEYVTVMVEKIRTKKGVDSRFGDRFDLKKFKSLPGSEVMLQYASAFLDRLGEGSSRAAFLLSSKYVLKIALNQKGIAQNKAELDVFTNPKSKNIVARVQSADPDFQWLVSDLVKPIKSEEEFHSLTGTDWETFKEALAKHVKRREALPANAPAFIKAVVATATENDLLRADLSEIDHWGKTPDGRVALLDYGYTRDVWASHYSKKPEELGRTAKPDEKTKGGDATKTKKARIDPHARTSMASTEPGGTTSPPTKKL